MPLYSDELIDEIRMRNDIVDVVSGYVQLKRAGANYKGLCPFHSEKTPSFVVSPQKQIATCFGCHKGGDVINFVKEIENISYKEAIEMLADRAGVNLPITNYSDTDRKQDELKKKVYEINELVANYYHEYLYKPEAKPGQEYVKKRKLNNKTLIDFKIGYAGNTSVIYKLLKDKGYTDDQILASGLVKKYDNGYMDVYRNRLIFPICDIKGRVVAFGGRVLMPEAERKELEKSGKWIPKYINSSDTIVYNKQRHLYGLNIAKKTKSGKLLIVEGYMDVISLHQRGIDYAIASLGTALTEAQGRLLRNNTERIVFGYDSDEAGQDNIIRGLNILQKLGCDVRILQLDDSVANDKNAPKDPDEYIIKYGPERFEKNVDNAISFVEYKVKRARKGLDLDSPNDKIKFLTQVAKILTEVGSDLERQVYMDNIAKTYSISKDAIYAEIEKLQYKNAQGSKILNRQNRQLNSMDIKDEVQEMDISQKQLNYEKLLIYLLINYPNESFNKIKEKIALTDIKSTVNKEIVQKIYTEYEKVFPEPENAIRIFGDNQNIVSSVSEIILTDYGIVDVNKSIEDVLKYFSKEGKIARRNEILKRLDEKGLDKNEINKLETELNQIILDLAKLK